jgi:DNA-binding NtrC family response regulator
MVEIGSFRKDLYHRLAVFPIMIPPLRARRDDIAPLAKALLSKIALDMGREGLKVSNAALTDLQRYDWPGNVRELRNTLERAIILCDGDVVDREHFQLSQRLADIDDELEYIEGQEGEGGGSSSGGGEQLLDLSLYELEKRALEHALSKHESRKAAAEHLGIPVRSLYNKIKRFELE